jgi:hypothetical protein
MVPGAIASKAVDKNRGFKTTSDGRLIIKDLGDDDDMPKVGAKRKRAAEDSGVYYLFIF